MSAQYSLKALAGAVLERTTERTLSAQCEKRPHNTPHSSPIDSEIELIRQWLFSIEEPESAHFLVIDKCKRDPQALAYFLRHANGGYESCCSVTTEADVDDRVRCSDCRYLYAGHCQQWRKINPHNSRYRPEQLTPKRCARFRRK